MSEARFAGAIGEEYRLFGLACPHNDELQSLVGKIIAEHKGSKERVLELGCANGYTTNQIAQYNPNSQITALDNERVMISQLHESMGDLIQSGQITPVENDALKYLRSLPDSSIDVIASAFVLHNFEDTYRSKILAETYRVLREGGLFVNADKYALDDPIEHQRSLDWQMEQFNVFERMERPDLKEEWVQHYIEDNQPEVIQRESDAVVRMRYLGFKDINRKFRKQMEAVYTAVK